METAWDSLRRGNGFAFTKRIHHRFLNPYEKVMKHTSRRNKTIAKLKQDLADGTESVLDLCSYYSDRISADEIDGGELNAVLALNPQLHKEAAEVDAEGINPVLPLAGVPLLIKDNILTDGAVPTTCGSLALQNWMPGADASLIKGLREAGALILGKANLTEWAHFRSFLSPSGWSSVGGQTRNPHVLNRDPSGSSSGSAVAVSASLCIAAVGTETGGSITIPASRNGIVGVKPTVGLVSRTGIIPISHRQDTAGTMTRTVRDAALLLTAMAGPDPNDPATEAIPDDFDFKLVGNVGASNLEGLRIGLLEFPDWMLAEAEPLYTVAQDLIRDLRATLSSGLKMADPSWGQQEKLALQTEFKVGLNEFFRSQASPPPVQTLADLIEFNRLHADTAMPIFGQEIFLQSQERDPLDPKYEEAVADVARLTQDEGLLQLLDGNHLDMIVAPTASPAAVVDHLLGSRMSGNFASTAAAAGYPHITVPMGTARHLPVGLSFVERPFSEPLLLQAADCFERTLGVSLEPQYIPSLEL